jgi:hypothetical protein
MEDDGRTAILIIRAHLADVSPDDPGVPWARITWRTDLGVAETEVVRPAGTRAGVHMLIGQWLDAIAAPPDAAGPPDTGAGSGS